MDSNQKISTDPGQNRISDLKVINVRAKDPKNNVELNVRDYQSMFNGCSYYKRTSEENEKPSRSNELDDMYSIKGLYLYGYQSNPKMSLTRTEKLSFVSRIWTDLNRVNEVPFDSDQYYGVLFKRIKNNEFELDCLSLELWNLLGNHTHTADLFVLVPIPNNKNLIKLGWRFKWNLFPRVILTLKELNMNFESGVKLVFNSTK